MSKYEFITSDRLLGDEEQLRTGGGILFSADELVELGGDVQKHIYRLVKVTRAEVEQIRKEDGE